MHCPPKKFDPASVICADMPLALAFGKLNARGAKGTAHNAAQLVHSNTLL